MPLYPTFTTLAAELGDTIGRTLQKILQCVQKTTTSGTALASAARTVSTLSTDIATNGCKGLIAYLNVTAAPGVGGIKVKLLLKDPLTGVGKGTVQATNTTNATGMFPFIIYPGVDTGSNMTVSANTTAAYGLVLGASIALQVEHSTADSYTYSLSYELIP